MSRILTPKGWRDLEPIQESGAFDNDKHGAHYGMGFHDSVGSDHKKTMKHIASKGYKVNHNDHGTSHTGDTVGSKPHAKPDVTIHYERGDKAHRDGPSGVTIHKGSAAHKDSQLHKHATKAQGEGGDGN